MNNQTENTGYKKMTGKEFMKTLDKTGVNFTARKNPYQPSGKAVLIGNTLFVSEEDFSKLSKIETATETFENLIISQVLDQPTTEYNSFYHKSFFHNLNFNTMFEHHFGPGRAITELLSQLNNKGIHVEIQKVFATKFKEKSEKSVSVYDGMKVKVKTNSPILAGLEMIIIEAAEPIVDKMMETCIKCMTSNTKVPDADRQKLEKLTYLTKVFDARSDLSIYKEGIPKTNLQIARLGELEFLIDETEFELVPVKAA